MRKKLVSKFMNTKETNVIKNEINIKIMNENIKYVRE